MTWYATRHFLCVTLFLGALLSVLVTAPIHAAGQAKGKKIAFLQTLATHPYVAATTKSFRASAEALGMEVTFFTSMLDAALQAQQIDDDAWKVPLGFERYIGRGDC
jgi:ABC-type sugar transport system substrate-binding protein